MVRRSLTLPLPPEAAAVTASATALLREDFF